MFFNNQEEGSEVISFWGDLGRDMEGDCIQSPATARSEAERTLLLLCFVFFRGGCSGNARLWDQAMKCVWWMPWRSQAMKDVQACEKLRGVGNETLIRRCPNGETRPFTERFYEGASVSERQKPLLAMKNSWARA